jgi:hypothetical protein
MLWNIHTQTKPMRRLAAWPNMGLKMLPLEKVSVLAALYTSMSEIAASMKNMAHRVLSPCRVKMLRSDALSLGRVMARTRVKGTPFFIPQKRDEGYFLRI